MRGRRAPVLMACLLAAGMVAAPVPGQSQGAGQGSGQGQVYDPQPPAGSAYMRFVNALDAELTLRPGFLPQRRLGTSPEQRVTAYLVVERVADRPLLLEAQAPSLTGRATLRAAPGSYVTVILHRALDGGIAASPVVDQAEFNRARARLSFYNATADCADARLSLAPDGTVIFQEVAPGAVKTRSVNPVSAELRGECGGQAAAPFALEGLEPGGTYSIWLMRPAGTTPIAFLGRDVTAPWRR